MEARKPNCDVSREVGLDDLDVKSSSKSMNLVVCRSSIGFPKGVDNDRCHSRIRRDRIGSQNRDIAESKDLPADQEKGGRTANGMQDRVLSASEQWVLRDINHRFCFGITTSTSFRSLNGFRGNWFRNSLFFF